MPDFTINPFANDAFSTAMLTEAITRLPYNIYGRVGELGLFTDEGVSTTSVIIEEQSGVLNLLPTSPRGAPSLLNTNAKRKARSFVIPHIGLDDDVLPDDSRIRLAPPSRDSFCMYYRPRIHDPLCTEIHRGEGHALHTRFFGAGDESLGGQRSDSAIFRGSSTAKMRGASQ